MYLLFFTTFYVEKLGKFVFPLYTRKHSILVHILVEGVNSKILFSNVDFGIKLQENNCSILSSISCIGHNVLMAY